MKQALARIPPVERVSWVPVLPHTPSFQPHASHLGGSYFIDSYLPHNNNRESSKPQTVFPSTLQDLLSRGGLCISKMCLESWGCDLHANQVFPGKTKPRGEARPHWVMTSPKPNATCACKTLKTVPKTQVLEGHVHELTVSDLTVASGKGKEGLSHGPLLKACSPHIHCRLTPLG